MASVFSKSFYNSKKWRITRAAYVDSRVNIDGGMCEYCGAEAGEEVHHVIALTPANIHDTEITLNWDNLKFLCKDCHFKAHREIIVNSLNNINRCKNMTNNGCYFDDDGNLIQIRRYIVWGSPASGKTTYVRQNMQRGDLIVDLDFIKQAISLQDKTDTPDSLYPVAVKIRELLYDLIAENKIDCKSVWVIASLPRKKERLELAERLGAELVHIDTDYHECIRRAGLDADRHDKQKQRALVDKFFSAVEL